MTTDKAMVTEIMRSIAPVAARRWDAEYPGGQWLHFPGDHDGEKLYRESDLLNALSALTLERVEAEPVAVATNIKRYDEHPDGGGMREDELGAYVKFEAVHQLEVRIAKLVDVLRNFTASRDISYVEALKLARVALGDYRSHSTLSKRGEAEETPAKMQHVRVTDEAILAACRAHTPQFDRLDPEISKYAVEQMRAALYAGLTTELMEAPHGCVCFNSGPTEWFWSEKREALEHELSNDMRPATHLEKYLFNKQGNQTHKHDNAPSQERLPYEIRLKIGRALDRLVCDDSTPEQVDAFIQTFAEFGLTISPAPQATAAVSTPSPEGRL